MRTSTPDNPDTCDAGMTIASNLRGYPGMNKIIDEYVADLPGEVSKMQDMLNRGDMQPLRRVVHQLRGTGGGYGFELISDTAAEAEAAIDAVSSRAAIALKIKSLIDVIRRTEGFDRPTAAATEKGGTL